MRSFGILEKEFFLDEKLQNLSPATRLTAVYACAGPHTNGIGCFRLPLNYMIADLKIPKRLIEKAIVELTEIRFLRFDRATNYFLIENFFSQRVKKSLVNQNNYTGAERELSEIPDSVPFKEVIRQQLTEIKEPDLIADPSPTDRRSIADRTREKKRERGEGEEEGEGEKEGESDENACGAAAVSPSSHASHSSFPSPLPKDFHFPLVFGDMEISREQVNIWQAQFPYIVVPAKLQKYQEYYARNPKKRMYKQGMMTAILRHLQDDNAEAEQKSTAR